MFTPAQLVEYRGMRKRGEVGKGGRGWRRRKGWRRWRGRGGGRNKQRRERKKGGLLSLFFCVFV